MATLPTTIEVDIHARAGIVRPGDKLVIATSQRLNMADADHIKRHTESQLPGVEVVLVQADALVVYRQ